MNQLDILIDLDNTEGGLGAVILRLYLSCFDDNVEAMFIARDLKVVRKLTAANNVLLYFIFLFYFFKLLSLFLGTKMSFALGFPE